MAGKDGNPPMKILPTWTRSRAMFTRRSTYVQHGKSGKHWTSGDENAESMTTFKASSVNKIRQTSSHGQSLYTDISLSLLLYDPADHPALHSSLVCCGSLDISTLSKYRRGGQTATSREKAFLFSSKEVLVLVTH